MGAAGISIRSGRRTRSVLLVLAGLCSVLPVVSNTPAAASAPARVDWPQYQGDAGHTGWDRGESILNPANVDRLKVLWIAPVGGDASAPIEAGGMFFAGSLDGYGVQAIDAETGRVIWAKTVSSVGSLPAPAVDGSSVLQPTPDHGLLALDPASGATLWESPVDGELGQSPTVAAGHVFVPGLDFNHNDRRGLYAFDAASGRRTNTRDVARRFGVAMAGAASRRVVWTLSSFRPNDSRVIAFADSGRRKIWTQRDGLGEHLSTPVIANGNAYLVSDGDVFDLDLLTGAPQWRTMDGAYTSLAHAGSQLFATSSFAGTVTELDAETGATGWTGGTGGLHIESPPVVSGGVVFVSSDDRIYAFDQSNGDLLWISLSLGSNVASLAVFGGRLYAQTSGRLWAFHLPKH
jgi:outer membrane protein assembly factor BamB